MSLNIAFENLMTFQFSTVNISETKLGYKMIYQISLNFPATFIIIKYTGRFDLKKCMCIDHTAHPS